MKIAKVTDTGLFIQHLKIKCGKSLTPQRYLYSITLIYTQA